VPASTLLAYEERERREVRERLEKNMAGRRLLKPQDSGTATGIAAAGAARTAVRNERLSLLADG